MTNANAVPDRWLSSQLQILLLGNTGSAVWTSCRELLCSRAATKSQMSDLSC